jgi:hypothetical protein
VSLRESALDQPVEEPSGGSMWGCPGQPHKPTDIFGGEVRAMLPDDLQHGVFALGALGSRDRDPARVRLLRIPA